MLYNLISGYGGAQSSGIPFTTGKVFFVDNNSGANFNAIDSLYITDPEGVSRRHSTIASALSACVVDRGDIIVLAPDFATALSSAELLVAETKGVRIVSALADKDGICTVYKEDTAIATTADKSLFTVTGLVEITQIVGKVGTVIQTQANNALLKINPTDGADVDLCSALDISASASKSFMTITGTLSDAMINTPSGAMVSQASSVIVNAGVIELETSANSTGSIKWLVKYKPLEAGARILSA